MDLLAASIALEKNGVVSLRLCQVPREVVAFCYRDTSERVS